VPYPKPIYETRSRNFSGRRPGTEAAWCSLSRRTAPSSRKRARTGTPASGRVFGRVRARARCAQLPPPAVTLYRFPCSRLCNAPSTGIHVRMAPCRGLPSKARRGLRFFADFLLMKELPRNKTVQTRARRFVQDGRAAIARLLGHAASARCSRRPLKTVSALVRSILRALCTLVKRGTGLGTVCASWNGCAGKANATFPAGLPWP
jgi:hypothetical protein